jgi:hypothetical protein
VLGVGVGVGLCLRYEWIRHGIPVRFSSSGWSGVLLTTMVTTYSVPCKARRNIRSDIAKRKGGGKRILGAVREKRSQDKTRVVGLPYAKKNIPTYREEKEAET